MSGRPRTFGPWLLIAILVPLLGLRPQDEHAAPDPDRGVQFGTVEVWIDSGAEALAAWQVEVRAPAGRARFVGIEGGEHPLFAEPPFYDPRAMQHERLIIAAFSTAAADRLPAGRTRVATLHVQISGDGPPRLESVLQAVATVEGREIDATVSLVTERDPERDP